MKRIALVWMACVIAVWIDSGFRAAEAGVKYRISIDKAAWERFGFQYPATYVFRLPGVPADAAVVRHDGGSKTVLTRKTPADFFNGVECVRFDAEAKKAYVSVGFHARPVIELEFTNVPAATFESMATYYDARRAAYTLSNDNWGCNVWAHPGAPWRGMTDDASDNYQASLHACRSFHLPVTMAINSHSAGGDACWRIMQEELDRRDFSWEPAVHGQTHPKDAAAYRVRGYEAEILGCRDEILKRLRNIPYGQHIYEHILTHGYCDEKILQIDSGHFLFLRAFNWLDNPASTGYMPWNAKYRFYSLGGLNTKGYDTILERREPKARYCARDVAELNEAFDRVHQAGGIFYALWHPDRFLNSAIYDPRPGVEGVRGSTLMQHLAHVANRKDTWYVANGWLYSYRFVADNARVVRDGE